MKDPHILKKVAFLSVPISVLIFGLKYWAYLLTGSVALYSDALESVVNVISALAVWWSVHISTKPADIDHPYGHYKAEYFSAGLVSMLIISAAGMILYSSIMTIVAGEYLFSLNKGAVINAGAALLNLIWGIVLLRFSKVYRSEALKADAKHIFTDVVTSFAVIIGLIVIYVGGWHIVDPLLAILVAVNILWEGWKIFNQSVQGLMDSALSLEEIAQIRQIIAHNASGALEVHDLKTRISGRAIFIEFHLVVDSQMCVGESHQICDNIEEALRVSFPNAYIIIHVEPEAEAKLPLGTNAVPFA